MRQRYVWTVACCTYHILSVLEIEIFTLVGGVLCYRLQRPKLKTRYHNFAYTTVVGTKRES